jgi:nucleotide-binding universal stress UspA family protein
MNREKKLLIATDGSDASERAVAYVSQVLEGRTDVRIRLFYVLPHLPPALLEWGGTADPKREQRFLDAERERFIKEAEEQVRPRMDRAFSLLVHAGIPESAIETQFFPSVATVDLVEDILEVARNEDFGTVVVGRECWSWIREKFRHHYCDELIRQANGLTVWVVE